MDKRREIPNQGGTLTTVLPLEGPRFTLRIWENERVGDVAARAARIAGTPGTIHPIQAGGRILNPLQTFEAQLRHTPSIIWQYARLRGGGRGRDEGSRDGPPDQTGGHGAPPLKGARNEGTTQPAETQDEAMPHQEDPDTGLTQEMGHCRLTGGPFPVQPPPGLELPPPTTRSATGSRQGNPQGRPGSHGMEGVDGGDDTGELRIYPGLQAGGYLPGGTRCTGAVRYPTRLSELGSLSNAFT